MERHEMTPVCCACSRLAALHGAPRTLLFNVQLHRWFWLFAPVVKSVEDQVLSTATLTIPRRRGLVAIRKSSGTWVAGWRIEGQTVGTVVCGSRFEVLRSLSMIYHRRLRKTNRSVSATHGRRTSCSQLVLR